MDRHADPDDDPDYAWHSCPNCGYETTGHAGDGGDATVRQMLTGADTGPCWDQVDLPRFARWLATQLAAAPGSGEVADAAVAWWEGRRPRSWDLAEHLRHPTVNTTTANEQALAGSVAAHVAATCPPERI